MIRIILEILLGAFFLIWGYWFADVNLQPELYGMSIASAGILFVEFVTYLIKEWTFIRLYWDCNKPFVRPEVRLTISYLYRIEVNGKYLLVKSNRIENTFQPVGGVYKYFHPEAKNDLDSIGAITDNNVLNDDKSEFDLRLKLLKRKNIRKFLKWFFSAQERECDPWREFYEELVVPGILPAAVFGYIHYELIGQHIEPIHYDNHFNIDTFKYADIYKPKLINASQIEELKKLIAKSHPDYIWATQQEIIKGKSNSGHLIAPHTHKIFHTKKINK
ncbi:MAG: hypothetical protein K0S26_2278 [Bacteroidota bacterium]|jgi:hypothetical protein|nr:hypothetical protein [Bacteroidota bacterium]